MYGNIFKSLNVIETHSEFFLAWQEKINWHIIKSWGKPKSAFRKKIRDPRKNPVWSWYDNL